MSHPIALFQLEESYIYFLCLFIYKAYKCSLFEFILHSLDRQIYFMYTNLMPCFTSKTSYLAYIVIILFLIDGFHNLI